MTQASAPYDLAVPGTAYFTGAAFFRALYPVYVRGFAYSRMGSHREAAAEFQKILDHPGLVLNDPIGPMAHGASDQLQLNVLDFPEGKGFLHEEGLYSIEASPYGTAFQTMKPLALDSPFAGWLDNPVVQQRANEGFKSLCFVPLISRNRAIGTLNLGRLRGDPSWLGSPDGGSRCACILAESIPGGRRFLNAADQTSIRYDQ